jgi:signal transduction histidine kinase
MPLHTLVPADLRPLHRVGLARYQDTGRGELVESGNPVELRGLHRGGQEFPIELTLTVIPERSPEGHRFALAVVRDLSERRAAERARLELHDAEIRRRQALELHDSVVQGLATAKVALEMDHVDKAEKAIHKTLENARSIVSGLLASLKDEGEIEPGDLVRRSQPDVDEEP